MQPEAKKYLFDMWQAADWIAAFVAGKTFEDYSADAMLRLAVERCFSILGEAMSQLARIDSATAGRIGEYQRIIAFRNILIHSYAETDDRLVWSLIETKLPGLREDVQSLLQGR